MNANAKAWVAALRSGKWTQAQNRLRRQQLNGQPGYCCLGVGTELARPVIGGEWMPAAHMDGVSYRLRGQESTHFLPTPVREWLGVRTQDGAFKGPLEEVLSADARAAMEAVGLGDHWSEAESLTELNDRGATLEQIAAVIELEPDGLFEVQA